jgi:hypothetical protein
METIEKRSYSEIKKMCLDIEKAGNSVFYRGTKVPYLLPSIVPKKNNLDFIHLLNIEKNLLKAFKNIYPHKFECDEVTKDWLYRIRAREHELASRLMDWSHIFYKALDFATKYLKSSEEYGYLWVLPMNGNEIVPFSDFRKYPIESISSSYMLRGVNYGKDNALASHRQFVQGGNFLIQPPHLLATKLNEQSEFMNRLICLKIPAIYAEDIRMDIIKFEGEDVNQDIMIEKGNCIDLICKTLNEKLLYSVSSKID